MNKTMILNSNGTLSYEDWQNIENYKSYKIPILYLSGSISGMNKDNAVTLNYIYGERSGTCTVKWQGASSLDLPKKNYTVKFDNAFEVVSGWGSQKKYVLKANFVDSSHARNIVCAKLWGQIVKSRTTANETLNALPNGGAIDGFPVIVAMNNKFIGLYTWNIPKDGWMFGMSGTASQQAILCANLNENGAVAFKGLATLNGDLDFDLEYSSNDESAWVLTSINRLISAVKDSDGTNITYGITPYLDWDSAIDYFIHAVLTANYDGIWRNYLLSTYDGIKWFFTGYDMDVVLGLRAMGKYFYSADTQMTFETVAGMHKVFELIWKYMRPQLRARYNALRATVMSEYNVANEFINFVNDIPLSIYCDDVRLWNTIPSSSANNLANISQYYSMRCKVTDEWIQNTTGETALPPQVDPGAPTLYTITNNLTNCTSSNSAGTVEEETSYTATITVNSGYILNTITVTMGGINITSTAVSGNTITIPSVTGNVVITATTTELPAYINQMPISIGTDGNIYNGTGWKGATRLSASSGTEKGADNVGVVGFIPVNAGDVVRFKDGGVNQHIMWNETGSTPAQCAVVYYDSSFAFLGGVTLQPAYYGICAAGNDVTGTTDAGGICSFTVPNNANIAYFRLSASTNMTDGSNIADIIITVNETIS